MSFRVRSRIHTIVYDIFLLVGLADYQQKPLANREGGKKKVPK